MIDRFTFTAWQRTFTMVPSPVGVRALVADITGNTGLAFLLALATAVVMAVYAIRTHTTIDGDGVSWSSGGRTRTLRRDEVTGAEIRNGSIGLIRKQDGTVAKLPVPYRNFVMPDADFDAKVGRVLAWLDGPEAALEADDEDLDDDRSAEWSE